MISKCSNCEAENPKYRCGNCKQVGYCSSDCQKTHWKEHKPECKMPSPTTSTTSSSSSSATLTSTSTNSSTINSKDNNNNDISKKIKTVIVLGMEAVSNSVSADELDKGNWEKCVVPAMLGEPLMVRVLGYPKKKPSNELAIFLMVEPVSGLAAPKWQMQVGRVEFARCDKTDLDVQTFWDLYSYIYHLMDYYGNSGFNYSSFKSRHLIPKSYHKYRDQEHEIQRRYQELRI